MSNVSDSHNLSRDHPSLTRFNASGDMDASFAQWKAGRDPRNRQCNYESDEILRGYTSNCSCKGRNAEQSLDIFRTNPRQNTSWASSKYRRDQCHNGSANLRSKYDDVSGRPCSAPCDLYNVDSRDARTMHSERSWRPPCSSFESQGPSSSRWQGPQYSYPDGCRQRAEFCIPSYSTSSYVLPAGARNPGIVPLARPYGRRPRWSRCRKAVPSTANLNHTPPSDHLVEPCDDQRIGLRLGDDGGCTFPYDIYMGRRRKSLPRRPNASRA